MAILQVQIVAKDAGHAAPKQKEALQRSFGNAKKLLFLFVQQTSVQIVVQYLKKLCPNSSRSISKHWHEKMILAIRVVWACRTMQINAYLSAYFTSPQLARRLVFSLELRNVEFFPLKVIFPFSQLSFQRYRYHSQYPPSRSRYGVIGLFLWCTVPKVTKEILSQFQERSPLTSFRSEPLRN